MDRETQQRLRALATDLCLQTWDEAYFRLLRVGLDEAEAIEELGRALPVTYEAWGMARDRHDELVKQAPEGIWPEDDVRRTEQLALARLREDLWRLLRPTPGYMVRRIPAEGKVRQQPKKISGVACEINRRGYPAVVKVYEEDGTVSFPRMTDVYCSEGNRRRRDEAKKAILKARGVVEFTDDEGQVRTGTVMSIGCCPSPRANIGLRVMCMPHDGGLREVVMLDDVRIPEIDGPEPEQAEELEENEILLVPE